MHLTPQQLAARWQISEKTLERWRRRGIGPGFLRVVGRVLYPLDQVEACEAQGLAAPTRREARP